MDEHTTVSSSKSSSAPDKLASSEVSKDQAALTLKSTVATGANDLKDEAKHVAGDLASMARQSAEARVSDGKDRAAETLGGVAKALRHTGEQLRTQDQSGLTDYVVRAADKVEAASDYLQGRSLRDVMGDVGDFARREPALFIGSAFTLGLLGGRFFKSTGAVSSQAGRAGGNAGGGPAVGASTSYSSGPGTLSSQGTYQAPKGAAGIVPVPGQNAAPSSGKVPGAT